MAATIQAAIGESFTNHACDSSKRFSYGGAVTLNLGLVALSRFVIENCAANDWNPVVPGAGLTLTNGQCPVQYRVQARVILVNTDSCEVVLNTTIIEFAVGPLSTRIVATGLKANTSCGGGPRLVPQYRWELRDGAGTLVNSVDYFAVGSAGVTIESITRVDGQPDSCGSPPVQPVPVLPPGNPNPPLPVGPDGSPFIPPATYNIVYAPITGTIPVTIPITIGPFEFNGDFRFPMNFSVEISGIRIGTVSLNIDGGVTINLGEPPTKPDELKKILEEIKECACSAEPPPDCPYDEVFFPVVESEESCEASLVSLFLLPGSLSPQTALKFNTSAALAAIGCESLQTPEQLPESLIYAATTLEDGRELFTGLIEPEVVSLRLKITSFQHGIVPVISTYPAANQRKFGSVAFVTQSVVGGGDSIYVYDTDTFIPLPKRGKPGKLRILMKPLISFEVYDTGERL